MPPRRNGAPALAPFKGAFKGGDRGPVYSIWVVVKMMLPFWFLTIYIKGPLKGIEGHTRAILGNFGST